MDNGLRKRPMPFCRKMRRPTNRKPANRLRPVMGATAPHAYRGAARVVSKHAMLHAGDLCPECRRGKVYCLKEPATLVRFVGHAPLEATVFEMERLRCNACGQIFKADEPDAAGPAKYDETAVAMIALLKYGTGVPFQRLERLQEQLGMPLSAATQWDLMAAAAEQIRPALEELIRTGGPRQRDAQRRHRHADTALEARAG